MTQQSDLNELRAAAARAGLELPDEELQRLAAGIARSRAQAGELRAVIRPDDEPAGIFLAETGGNGRGAR